ncbi:MAG: orotate phosphoribosyltransferase [Bacteriovoracaceae bacterium]|nr:orotate phosphoribosyltransferase [Bacteriovoracaceae bacterium]
MSIADRVAEALLTEKAVFLRPEEPFTWASGIKSPIYCDNRLLISKPKARKMITLAFKELITSRGLKPDVIAGTATAGIPWAAWIAEALDLPMIYVRSGSKDHGRKNLIEGEVTPSANVLLIEDLISTGKSSLAALEVLEASQMKVLAVMSLFHYNFPQAHEIFKKRGVEAISLCFLDDMLNWAKTQNSLSSAQAEEILSWRQKTIFP